MMDTEEGFNEWIKYDDNSNTGGEDNSIAHCSRKHAMLKAYKQGRIDSMNNKI